MLTNEALAYNQIKKKKLITKCIYLHGITIPQENHKHMLLNYRNVDLKSQELAT